MKFAGIAVVMASAFVFVPNLAASPNGERVAMSWNETDEQKNAASTDAKEENVQVAEADKKEAEMKKEAEKPAGGAGDLSMSPLDYAAAAEKGKLKNPYTGNAKAIEEGKGLYFSYSCNGCHGGGAGGGMCPPITNEVWIYGSNDDVLFRLISQGSQKLLDSGYKRIRSEKVKGPMPPFGELVENADEMWKIIAWLRTKYKGRKKSIDWE